jgi:hypothetical protein
VVRSLAGRALHHDPTLIGLPSLALVASVSGGFLLASGLHRQTTDVSLSSALGHYLLLPPSVFVRRADGGFFRLSLLSAIGQKTNLALGILPNLAI